MLILHSHTNQSPTTLSFSQVQELLLRGLTQNRAAAQAGIQHPETWVSEQLLSRVKPAALTVKGWEAVATAVSLQPVASAEQVQQLVAAFTENLSSPPDEKSLDSMFYLFARHHRSFDQFSFDQLLNLTRFVTELYREQGPQAYVSINTVLQQCDSSLGATPVLRITGAYFLPEDMLHPEHLEAVQRRIRISLLAQEALRPTDLGRYIVEHSRLPQEQREHLSSWWESLSKQFPEQPAGLDLGGLSIPYGVAKAVRALERINSLLDGLWERGLARFDMACIMKRFGECSAIVETYSRLERLRSFSTSDAVQFFELLASANSVAILSNLIRFADKYQVPFRAVAPDLGKLPPETIDRYQFKTQFSSTEASPVFAPREKRTVQELMEIGQGLGRVAKDANSLSPRQLDLAVELYDHLQTSINSRNFPVVTGFVRNLLAGEARALRPCDVKRLRFALQLYEQLQKLGHGFAEAVRISLNYVTTKTYKNSANRQVLRSLLQPNPEDYMSKAITSQARNPKVSDQIFLQTLTLAGSIYPVSWGFIRSAIGDSADLKNIAMDVFRAAMAKLQHSSHDRVLEAVSELLDAKYQMVIRRHLLAYIQASTRESRREAGTALNQIYNLDTGPYPQASSHDENEINPEYRRMWDEVMEVYRGIFDLHYGFGHSTFECKAPPMAEDWLLLRFAFDSAIGVSRLVGTDAHAFPGPGCLISGLRLERLFVANPETPDDPYSLYKDAWRWIAHVIDDLPRTSFLMSRGVKMFVGPDEPTYRLDGLHYGLVVWNEHFDNPLLSAAALVPVSIIKSALRGRVKRIEELGDRPTPLKVAFDSGIGLKFQDLKRACEEMHLPFLNLGWASNIGGLCNAYAPCSPPYFEWERQLSAHDKDGAGHVHKSHIKGYYVSTADAETTRLLLPLRQAHDSVYRIASAYLGLSDLFRISLALWHKGLTLTEQMGEDRELAQDSDEEEQSLSANELKMLEEAYRWNDLHQHNVVDPNAFPVLCIAPTFDSWNMTSSPVILDTYDLTLRLPDGSRVSLDRRTGHVPDFLVGLWASRVRPLYRNLVELDLRFLDRQSVRWSPVKN